jgi:hypothetical protein
MIGTNLFTFFHNNSYIVDSTYHDEF